jgi:hypothetical protein
MNRRLRVLLGVSALALAVVGIWAGSQAAANAPGTSWASACCPPDYCPPDCCPPDCCPGCCAETMNQTSAERTGDCCEPTCCQGDERESISAKQECCPSGGCCAK